MASDDQSEDRPGDRLALRLPDRLAAIAPIIARVDGFLLSHGVATTPRHTIGMVLDELLNNVVSYAFGDGREHWIDVRVVHTSDRVTIEIEDDGRAFDPFARPAPDTSLGIDARRIGGLGVHLVRNTMDEVAYVRRDEHNLVRVGKRIAPEPPRPNRGPA